MKIYIIRHGDPDYVNDSLTEKGFIEAEMLSDRMVKERISDFYCSPLGRARATAKPTLDKYNTEAKILPWLAEFRGAVKNPTDGTNCIPWNLSPQYWTKQPELFDKEKWLENGIIKTGDVKEIYQETTDGMDALMERYGYVRDGYIFRCDQNLKINVAIFCHFAVGQAMLGHMLGISPVLLWHATFLPPTSVTTLVSEERNKGEVYFRCAQMGDTSHLYAGGEPVSTSGLF